METAALLEMFERVITLPTPAPSDLALEQLIGDAIRLEAVLASRRTLAMAELAGLSSSAESVYAKAAHVSVGQANRTLERANMLAAVDPMAVGFAAGRLSVAHVDAFWSIYRAATIEVRSKLVEHAGELAFFGETSTPDELRKRTAAKAREYAGVEDAEERLIRQKKATRLSMRVDPDSGMGRVFGWFDPETFWSLHRRIISESQALFHDKTPEYCPLDPIERRQFLLAHALAALIAGTGISTSGGTPDIVVVKHCDGDLTIDWGLDGLELPDSSLDRLLANRARIFNVTVRNGDIVSAPGNLNVGRNARLANRAQRRALAAVHSTCCVPGCEVRYWQTKIHHLIEWENGGLTDLNNLVPLCARHHTQLHKDSWKCQLLPGRRVVFTLPDGTVLANAPPHPTAA
jgi:HNH endonuclease